MDGLLRVTIKRHKVFLTILFIASLLVRLLFFYAFLHNNPLQLSFDSGHYHDVACALSNGNGFTNADGSAHCYRLPGYPVFLALLYACGDTNVTLALLVQIVLASLIPILIFLLSLLVFPQATTIAFLASAVSAVHVGFVTFAGLVMSETLFAFFFLLFLIFFLYAMRDCSWRVMAGAGLMLGCASLIRPVGVWIVVLSILFIFLCKCLGSHPSIRFATQITQGERGVRNPFVVSVLRDPVPSESRDEGRVKCIEPYERRSKFVAAGMLCATWLLVVSMWLARNWFIAGGLFLHTLPGPHFLNHGASRVVMTAQHISYQQAQRQIYAEYEALLAHERAVKHRALHEYERSAIAEHYAIGIMFSHPLQTMQLCCINMVKTVLSLYSSELLCIDSGGQLPPYDTQRSWKSMLMRFLWPSVHNRMIAWVIYVELLMHFFIMMGVLGWLVHTLRRRKKVTPTLWYLWCVSAVLIGLSCVCGYARLRLPIEPFFIMLAVSFWMNGAMGKRVE